MGTETLAITKQWIEIEPVGTLLGIQNWSGVHLDLVFAAEAPALTDTGTMVEPGDTLRTIPSGRCFARLAAFSAHTKGTVIVLTADAPAPA